MVSNVFILDNFKEWSYMVFVTKLCPKNKFAQTDGWFLYNTFPISFASDMKMIKQWRCLKLESQHLNIKIQWLCQRKTSDLVLYSLQILILRYWSLSFRVCLTWFQCWTLAFPVREWNHQIQFIIEYLYSSIYSIIIRRNS